MRPSSGTCSNHGSPQVDDVGAAPQAPRAVRARGDRMAVAVVQVLTAPPCANGPLQMPDCERVDGLTGAVALETRDAELEDCETGNAVDFANLPPGVQPDDIVDVRPRPRNSNKHRVEGADYAWSLYSEEH